MLCFHPWSKIGSKSHSRESFLWFLRQCRKAPSRKLETGKCWGNITKVMDTIRSHTWDGVVKYYTEWKLIRVVVNTLSSRIWDGSSILGGGYISGGSWDGSFVGRCQFLPHILYITQPNCVLLSFSLSLMIHSLLKWLILQF